MTTSSTRASVSRRAALAGLSAGGLGLALAAHAPGTIAKDAATDLADHPLVGTWLSIATPADPAAQPVVIMATFAADGSVYQGFTTAQVGPQGVIFASPGIGRWEATGPRTTHFTSVIVLSDGNGTFLGTATIDGHPEVSEDGMSFIDNAVETTETVRDAANNILSVTDHGGRFPTVTAIRLSVGAPGFPEPSEATPIS